MDKQPVTVYYILLFGPVEIINGKASEICDVRSLGVGHRHFTAQESRASRKKKSNKIKTRFINAR